MSGGRFLVGLKEVNTSNTIKQSGLSARLAAETVLDKLINGVNFTCASHQNYGRRLANIIISNIYFNNQRELLNDKVAKNV